MIIRTERQKKNGKLGFTKYLIIYLQQNEKTQNL